MQSYKAGDKLECICDFKKTVSWGIVNFTAGRFYVISDSYDAFYSLESDAGITYMFTEYVLEKLFNIIGDIDRYDYAMGVV